MKLYRHFSDNLSVIDSNIISAVKEFNDVMSDLQTIKRSKFKERTEESSATQYFQVCGLVA